LFFRHAGKNKTASPPIFVACPMCRRLSPAAWFYVCYVFWGCICSVFFLYLNDNRG
jgi:hypothetical protein